MNFIKNFKKILCLFSHPDDETPVLEDYYP